MKKRWSMLDHTPKPNPHLDVEDKQSYELLVTVFYRKYLIHQDSGVIRHQAKNALLPWPRNVSTTL